MRRGVVIGFAALGVIAVVLAVTLATIGTQLDQARLERNDLQFQVEDLQSESDTLRTERDSLQKERETLKTQVGEQLKAMEQLKGEVSQARSQPQSSETTASAP